VIPLILMSVLLVAFVWYLVVLSRRFRKRVRIEAKEALEMLDREFRNLNSLLDEQEEAVRSSRKTKKLTKSESDMIQVMGESLRSSQRKVQKEIADITELAKKKDK
jgi:biopolymer transport protein ExbB/TolQ